MSQAILSAMSRSRPRLDIGIVMSTGMITYQHVLPGMQAEARTFEQLIKRNGR